MSLAAIKSLRERLRTDAALAAFWQVNYGRDAKHLIGYKRAPSAKDYPSVCYVQIKSIHRFNADNETRLSLVVAVHEKGLTDEIFDGVARLDELVELIKQAFIPLRLDDEFILSAEDLEVIHDLEMRHPFHELEIKCRIKKIRGEQQ